MLVTASLLAGNTIHGVLHVSFARAIKSTELKQTGAQQSG